MSTPPAPPEESLPPDDETLRYRASTRLAYGFAILALVEYAWASRDDYLFGPLSVDALVDQGLVVTGPDLRGVRAILGSVPGLEPSAE